MLQNLEIYKLLLNRILFFVELTFLLLGLVENIVDLILWLQIATCRMGN